MAGGVKQGAFLSIFIFLDFWFFAPDGRLWAPMGAYERRNRQITARKFIYTLYYVGINHIMSFVMFTLKTTKRPFSLYLFIYLYLLTYTKFTLDLFIFILYVISFIFSFYTFYVTLIMSFVIFILQTTKHLFLLYYIPYDFIFFFFHLID